VPTLVPQHARPQNIRKSPATNSPRGHPGGEDTKYVGGNTVFKKTQGGQLQKKASKKGGPPKRAPGGRRLLNRGKQWGNPGPSSKGKKGPRNRVQFQNPSKPFPPGEVVSPKSFPKERIGSKMKGTWKIQRTSPWEGFPLGLAQKGVFLAPPCPNCGPKKFWGPPGWKNQRPNWSNPPW